MLGKCLINWETIPKFQSNKVIFSRLFFKKRWLLLKINHSIGEFGPGKNKNQPIVVTGLFVA